MKKHRRFRNFASARADYDFAGKEWRACKKGLEKTEKALTVFLNYDKINLT